MRSNETVFIDAVVMMMMMLMMMLMLIIHHTVPGISYRTKAEKGRKGEATGKNVDRYITYRYGMTRPKIEEIELLTTYQYSVLNYSTPYRYRYSVLRKERNRICDYRTVTQRK
jgi:hypothetical protein